MSIDVPAKIVGDNPVVIHIQAAVDNAKEALQESVSEFISFITSEASDKCVKEKRKTINGDDVLWAMGTLGFEHYVEPLRVFLFRYREARQDGGLEEGGGGGGGGGGSGSGAAQKKR